MLEAPDATRLVTVEIDLKVCTEFEDENCGNSDSDNSSETSTKHK